MHVCVCVIAVHQELPVKKVIEDRGDRLPSCSLTLQTRKQLNNKETSLVADVGLQYEGIWVVDARPPGNQQKKGKIPRHGEEDRENCQEENKDRGN